MEKAFSVSLRNQILIRPPTKKTESSGEKEHSSSINNKQHIKPQKKIQTETEMLLLFGNY